MAAVRTVTVPSVRLDRWVRRFAATHGGDDISSLTASLVTGGLRLQAVDGVIATIEPIAPGWQHDVDVQVNGDAALAELIAHCERPWVSGIVLVRRGGFAVAVTEGQRVKTSKVGSRYVQSRTAAGGWSQQRFARRRQNQADELVLAVVEHTVAILLPRMPLDLLITGGDRPLVRDVLAHPRLVTVRALPVAVHLTVGDPKAATLTEAAEQVASVRIMLDDGEA